MTDGGPWPDSCSMWPVISGVRFTQQQETAVRLGSERIVNKYFIFFMAQFGFIVLSLFVESKQRIGRQKLQFKGV